MKDLKTMNSFPDKPDKEFTIIKQLIKRIRKLASLDKLRLDESLHQSELNLHLFKYLDYCGIDKLEYLKKYLMHLQPFMIKEFSTQEKFDNAICILDNMYRISLYIKLDTTKGEEMIISFHENNKNGIATKSKNIARNGDRVFVIPDSIDSYVEGQGAASIKLFSTRGIRTFPIHIGAVRYDEDYYSVNYTAIDNAIVAVCNEYLEDLYTADLDFSKINIFSTAQQLSYTSYGNDKLSNISLLIDSFLIQDNQISREVSDSALCIYCSHLILTDNEKSELLDILKTRYSVNSSRIMPYLLERVENNIEAIK